MVETGKKPQSREKGAPRSVLMVREGSPFPGSKKKFFPDQALCYRCVIDKKKAGWFLPAPVMFLFAFCGNFARFNFRMP